jgi:hypothetical protein
MYGWVVSADTHASADDDIAAVVARLSRPDRSGRRVIEHAAITAEGSRSAAILEWLATEGWTPEEAVVNTAYRGGAGLHGGRLESERGDARAQAPRRYVSPPGA